MFAVFEIWLVKEMNVKLIYGVVRKSILIYHMGSVSFVLSGGSNLIFHTHCLLSKKLVAVLIVTGEGGAETITDDNTIYIFPQGNNLTQHPPTSKTARVKILNYR